MASITITGFVAEGYKATFGVSTSIVNPAQYVWKRNGEPIPGAPSAASYTTPELRRQDMGNKYSVIVVGRDGSKDEAPAIGFYKER